ncbi:hypothetical protein DW133_08465 [Sutterella sp. AM11-39]|nr:hypothetical protein DW133_08465 [Sutterella sp. AM11-39]
MVLFLIFCGFARQTQLARPCRRWCLLVLVALGLSERSGSQLKTCVEIAAERGRTSPVRVEISA